MDFMEIEDVRSVCVEKKRNAIDYIIGWHSLGNLKAHIIFVFDIQQRNFIAIYNGRFNEVRSEFKLAMKKWLNRNVYMFIEQIIIAFNL